MCDELWNRGDKKIPEIKTKIIEPEAKAETKSEQTKSNKTVELKEETKKEQKMADSSSEEEPSIPVEEMDQIVIEAFYRSLHEGVQDSELPMEPANLIKKYLSEYHMNDGSVIDLKQSSFKKIGKLLDI